MRILVLAAANSIHTQRWVDALVERNLHIVLVTQHPSFDWQPGGDATVRELPFNGNCGYILNSFSLRRIIAECEPDILHAHYASGYGTTAGLVGFHPTLLSVWGSDIFDFPKTSVLHRILLNWNLRRASRIASTSKIMARQVSKIAPASGTIAITPFGVNCRLFAPKKKDSPPRRLITIGTVKTMAPKYGIDTLIRAFALLMRDEQIISAGLHTELRLLLVGGGPDLSAYQSLVSDLGIASTVTFAGQVSHASVASWLERLDVYVAASREESFGVAVIEASACGLPVVVSDVGGLPEVVDDKISGFIFPHDKISELSRYLRTLVLESGLRMRMGQAGRERVMREYEWENCVDKMISLYDQMTTTRNQCISVTRDLTNP